MYPKPNTIKKRNRKEEATWEFTERQIPKQGSYVNGDRSRASMSASDCETDTERQKERQRERESFRVLPMCACLSFSFFFSSEKRFLIFSYFSRCCQRAATNWNLPLDVPTRRNVIIIFFKYIFLIFLIIKYSYKVILVFWGFVHFLAFYLLIYIFSDKF